MGAEGEGLDRAPQPEGPCLTSDCPGGRLPGARLGIPGVSPCVNSLLSQRERPPHRAEGTGMAELRQRGAGNSRQSLVCSPWGQLQERMLGHWG